MRTPKKAGTLRMGGRVVEGTGLENRRGGDVSVGSNPTPSANSSIENIGCATNATGFSPTISKNARVSAQGFESHPIRHPRQSI